MVRSSYIFLLLLFFSRLAISQETNTGEQKIKFTTSSSSLSTLIETIENQSDFFVSYNPDEIDLKRPIKINNKELSLSEIVELLSKQLESKVSIKNESRKILILPQTQRTLLGIVRDSITMESLLGVAVYTSDGTATFTNSEGYFHLNINTCLLYTSPSPRDLSTSRMPSSA